jgi:soluble epoxide hydrolase / lipid-phosphate phosphatase
MELLSKQLPKLTYNLYFQRNTDAAIAELDKDIRRSLRSMLRNVDSPPPDAYLTSRSSFLEAYQDMDTIPPSPLMTPEEEDYYVEQYAKQGFRHSESSALQVHKRGVLRLYSTAVLYIREPV